MSQLFLNTGHVGVQLFNSCLAGTLEEKPGEAETLFSFLTFNGSGKFEFVIHL